jgi:competence protein ComEC
VLSHPWRPVPLFRVALPFTIGIGSAFRFPDNYYSGASCAFVLLLIPALIVFFSGKRHFRYYVIQGFLLQLICCFQGYTAVLLAREELHPSHFTRQDYDWCKVRLLEDPALRGKRLRATAVVEEIGDKDVKKLSSGKLLCYFANDSLSGLLRCNDLLITHFNWSELPLPRAEGDFNYRLFMKRRQVYGQLQIKNYAVVTRSDLNSIRSYAFTCRRKLMHNLQSQLSGREFAVAAALLIGEDDYVDKPLMSAFTATGTLHVLSVSGMHVGLIYMLLALLIGKLETKKGWRIGYFILLYGFLWGYALITGLSAPVVRSAMMLSLVLSGKLLERKSPVLNTLTGSFLLLMIVNPYWLTETGFQLSYLAVFGIMSLHPLLLQQFEFSRLWMHRIWELISVSLCAQLITVPVGLYYFGQFPNYFLISNLVIIPISTIAIYGGIFCLLTSFVPYLGSLIAFLEGCILKLLNAITLFLGGLPGSVAYPGKISLLNCLMMYLLLYQLVKWLQSRSAHHFQQVLAGMIVWSLIVLLKL